MKLFIETFICCVQATYQGYISVNSCQGKE